MGLETPKVALEMAGKPLVAHVAQTLLQANICTLIAVVSDWTRPYLEAMNLGFIFARQPDPRGTGDATRIGVLALDDSVETVVVACGDSPLFGTETVFRLLDEHEKHAAAVTLTSCELDNPAGYGRIVRGPKGLVTGIIEEKQASECVRAIREVNGGLYAFNREWLKKVLQKVEYSDREFVLTEVVSIAVNEGRTIAVVPVSSLEIGGVNTPEELNAAERLLTSERKPSNGRADS